MFIKELKEATAQAHQQLDKMLIPHIKSAATPQQYAALLKCFYGYFHPVESLISRYINDNVVPSFTQRRKSDVILAELNAMGESVELPVASVLPDINNLTEAFGSMYVLEGSTLGGKIITRILAGNLQKDPSQIRFFNFYGDNTEAYWQSFSEALNAYADTLDDAGKNAMKDAATETFYRFKEWIELSYIIPTSTV